MAVQQSTFATTNLNLIFAMAILGSTPNLIPASISGYIVYSMLIK